MRAINGLCRVMIAAISIASFPVMAAEHTTEPLSKIRQVVADKQGVLVDVREKQEWDAGHIEGAISLPISEVQDGLSIKELKRLPKDKVLYVYCVVGKRALTVGNILEKQGYQVKVLKPGYREMVAAGFSRAKD